MRTCVFDNGDKAIVCDQKEGGVIFHLHIKGGEELPKLMFQPHDFRKMTDSLRANGHFHFVAQKIDVVPADLERVTTFLEKFL